jgi:hypothetical protein
MQIQRPSEIQFSATALLNKWLKFEVHLKVMCTSDAAEQFFLQ